MTSLPARALWLALAACALACGGAAPARGPGERAAKAPGAAADKDGAAFGLPRTWPASRVVPDVDLSRRPEHKTPEGDLRLAGRLRVRTRPDGVIERAEDLLPVGRVAAVRLPTRLGGGFVFVGATGRGTELWRASSWLDKLTPLTSVGPAADMDRPLSIGFDRIYLRLASTEIMGIDPRTGAASGLGPLPPAPSYGEMLFLDGWRGVVDTDLAGPMVTFDAGATWRRLGANSRVRALSPSETDPDDGGDAIVTVEGGYYVVGAKGDVAFFRGPPPQGSAPPASAIVFATPPGAPDRAPLPPAPEEKAPRAGPLGRKPLRTALEIGYPDSAKTAVVAREGALVRVSLDTGAVLETRKDAYAEGHAQCQGIALAGAAEPGKPPSDIGFVCGQPGGATTVYAYEAPLRMRPVLEFSGPRVVIESGQGALVVRGTCADGEAPRGVRPFCVRFVDGSTREVRVRGEVGAERVVALADGRVAILVPPRPGTQGQLSILDGARSKHVPLKVPDGAPREVETGMWLEGFQQVGKEAIGGWIEAGGPTFGVKVGLDGAVTVGEVVDERGGVLVAGRFALAIGDGGKLLESTDTGMTWREASLPAAFDAVRAPRAYRCGAAGCALDGWLRVGWGEPAAEGDLRDAPVPEPQKLSAFKLSSAAMSFTCARGRTEPKPKQSGKKSEGEASTGWIPFRGVEPPRMAKGDVGFDAGSPFDAVPVRAYTWGTRESDWGRTGRMLVRFEDKFALDAVRSSAVSASPWATEQAAADAFGVGGWGIQWAAFRDSSGTGAILGSCRGRLCALFAVEDKQPVLPLRTSDPNGLVRPLPGSVVRVGQSWFFLGDEGSGDRVGFYRAELGRVRQVAVLLRPLHRRGAPQAPRLVRRAKGLALGLMFVQKDGPFDKRGTRYVMPIDADTGAVSEAVSLGHPDLAGAPVTACEGHDGWVVELGFVDQAPTATIDGAAQWQFLGDFDARLRLDEGAACIEAAVATVGSIADAGGRGARSEGGGPPKKAAAATGKAVPLIVTDRADGARVELSCRIDEP